MLFIEGVGYVNENTYIANRTQQVSETTNRFDTVLQTETDKLNQTESTKSLDAIFKEASERYGVSEQLLKAIAYTESGFQADATSSAGAMGIMQLMPSTAQAYGVTNPYDAYQNIMGGAAVIQKLLQMFDGNQSLVIAAYNAGCGNVLKYGGIPPFTETQNHVKKVTALMQSGVSVPNTTYPVSSLQGTDEATGASSSQTTGQQSENSSDISETLTQRNAELLEEIKDIISALSLLSSDSNRELNTISQSGLSALTGNYDTTTDSYSSLLSSYSSSLSTYNNPVSTVLSALDNVDITDTDQLENLLSYAEYQLFSTHYQNMLDIISVLGSTSLSGETDTNDSLSDLFRLATRQSQSRVANIDFSGVTLQ